MGNTFKLGNYVNGLFQDASNNIGIGGSPSGSYKLEVTGTLRNTTSAYFATTSGSVGIAATDPVKTLDVRGTLAISNSSSSYWYMDRDDSDGRFKILTDGNSEKFTILTSGNVGIGTSSPIAPLSIPSSVTNSQITTGSIEIQSFGTNNSWIADNLYYNNGFKARVTGYTSQIYFNTSGGISFLTNNGQTTAGATSALGQRMEITSGGYIVTSSVTYGNTTGAAANMYLFGVGDYGIGRSVSSAKYKTQVEDVEKNYVDNIYKMRPIWYRSLCERDRKDWSHFGFIAEEMAEIEPRFVHWNKDEDGNDIAEGVQYDRITALLVAAVQELNQQNQDLKSRLDKAGL